MDQNLTELQKRTHPVGGISLPLSSVLVNSPQKVDSLEGLKPAILDFTAWKPRVDQAVTNLQSELGDLRSSIDKLAQAATATSGVQEPPPSLGSARISTLAGDSGATARLGPIGHHSASIPRGLAFGEFSPSPTPDKGTSDFPTDPVSSEFRSAYASTGTNSRLEFPPFDGENPVNWRLKSEAYFRACGVHRELWIDTAVVYFSGAAELWLQWSQAHLRARTWDQFVEAIQEKFGRQEFQQHVRQFSRLRQTGTVLEYAEQFNAAMHRLRAHHASWDPLYFVTQFVDGLLAPIKVVVMLHRPPDLDTAVSLAVLQEEALTLGRNEVESPVPVVPVRQEFPSLPRSVPRTALPLPPPPGFPRAQCPPPPAAPPDDRRASGLSRDTRSSYGAEEKLKTMRAYRRARGLCFVCGEKWQPGHVCSATVQLHVVQELLDLLHLQESESGTVEDHSELCVISLAAVSGAVKSNTVRLRGMIRQQEVLMLVDSGSSHSFLSSTLAAQWLGIQAVPCPLKVQIANGGIMPCTHQVSDCQWWTEGCDFQTTFKLLPLGCYDVILGMDWLEEYNPQIDWVSKSLQLFYHGSTVRLHGVLPQIAQCRSITLHQIQALDKRHAICHVVHLSEVRDRPPESPIPPPVGALLHEFEHVFEEPHGLPPHRDFDHSILLLPGAKPVNIRPYRYNPTQKNEIERQVQDMLTQGIIQPSSSPFASPVLLVQKKDGEWRFCIDYRHLNAITVKNRFPLPVIDELMDELSGACWFTSLDLRAGYHQIRMNPLDEHKTAFQTHQGHYEFKVMSYGLTGAPATFQNAMNSILAPFLRRFVLVFIDDILIYSPSLETHVQHVRAVLQMLHQHDLKLKRKKCSFAQPELKYLGHVISAHGVATDGKNLDSVQSWPTPECVKEVRGFLGLAGYYRKFVRNFGVLSRPLTDLLKKGTVFVWTGTHEAAFCALKQALLTAPVLALPNFSKTFVIETDASDKGIGADHRSLAHLDDQRLTTPWQQKALTKLLGLQYRIEYKKGSTNQAADALSRRLSVVSCCLLITLVKTDCFGSKIVSGWVQTLKYNNNF
ncbi:uncharacterized protein LOC112268670 [Brachypodium distachyon]|uniref:uncharacterized protein LOC112268670 n=1 Tax=Brachypodium distachyon TaxID=15368 RepID=UPI000D0C9DA9|nr:uncharacterized protein LOC112268670 [Brachypodium distachyon]|eukprot:XP_024310364.1 uncharacterized protein LOC112268670 [Brachypodium distachyon]